MIGLTSNLLTVVRSLVRSLARVILALESDLILVQSRRPIGTATHILAAIIIPFAFFVPVASHVCPGESLLSNRFLTNQDVMNG